MMSDPQALKALYTISKREICTGLTQQFTLYLSLSQSESCCLFNLGEKNTYLFSLTNKGGFVGRLEFFILPTTTDEALNGGSKVALKSIKALSQSCQKQHHEATII